MTGDLLRVAFTGLAARRLRAALSGLGVAIGVASIVAVLGLSASSRAGLLTEIDALGTNLLTVTPGQSIAGGSAELPVAAAAMIARIGPVTAVQSVGLTSAGVYRSPYIPSSRGGGLTVAAATLGLPAALHTELAQGSFLSAATASRPVAVLGATAARRLGIDRVLPGGRIWLGGQWFYLRGILRPATLAPELDGTVLVGYPAAERYLGFDGHPSTIYLRARTGQVAAVSKVLAATADPASPAEVAVSRPSSTLTARAAAQSALSGLFLGLGAVALLVGGIGVANTMVVSVLERRAEIGLRRALGATRGDIRFQFLTEAMLLAGLGGLVGLLTGCCATALYAGSRGWQTVLPTQAWAGGLAAAVLIGGVAGLVPALRAARLAPTDALSGVLTGP